MKLKLFATTFIVAAFSTNQLSADRELSLTRYMKEDKHRNRASLQNQNYFLTTYNWQALYESSLPTFMGLFPFAYYEKYNSYPPIYYDYYDKYGIYPQKHAQFDDLISGQIQPPKDFIERNPCKACLNLCEKNCLSRGFSRATCANNCKITCQAQCTPKKASSMRPVQKQITY